MGIKNKEIIYGVEFNPYLRIGALTVTVESEEPKTYMAYVELQRWTNIDKEIPMDNLSISLNGLTDKDITFQKLYELIEIKLNAVTAQ
jgi:hypothetical protein